MDCKLTFFSITPALYTLPAFVRKFSNNSCKNNHVFIHTEKTLNKINMKNLLIILFACFMAGQVYGQEISVPEVNTKFGKPSDEELKMTTYAPDTTATAVVLCKKTGAFYDFVADDFRLNYSYETKIKILKPEGTSFADICIPYYENENRSSMKETVSQIDAFAYNIENGKTVRTKMKREFIYKERLNDKYMQVKFSIPNVKVGTVIEYKYKVLSDFYFNINDWSAQQSIPTLYTEYDITVPEYFKFNLDVRGTERLETTDDSEAVNLSIGNQLLQCNGRHLNFKGRQLPALHDDDYIWCVNDYSTQVNFELGGLDFPGALYKSFTQSWENIDKMLLEDSEFGGQLKIRNPYREEMAALNLDQLKSIEEKISAIYTFLKGKITWNEEYSLYGGKSKKVIKDGMGNNAEINFILMSMLRDADIPSFPVVMSRRNIGILPYSHPSVQKLNTFIVGVANTDSTLVYLDGSVRDGYINILPPVLMVNRARVIMPGKGGLWVDLSKTCKNQLRSIVNATISPDGKICGNRNTSYTGQYASSFRRKYRTAKDSTEFVNELATQEDIKVNVFNAQGVDRFSPQVKETVIFEKQATTNDNFIYLNPLIFLHTEKNPFTQAERKLPVEYPFTDQVVLSVNLTLPEGYTVDELPKPLLARTEDKQGMCRYVLEQKENKLTINYTFSSSKLLYLPEEYPGLQNFWKVIAEKNNETVVLKKL